jgi:hypothetical protein
MEVIHSPLLNILVRNKMSTSLYYVYGSFWYLEEYWGHQRDAKIECHY